MKREDIMNGIGEIDADLVEKFIDVDRKLQEKANKPTGQRFWLKIGAIAACAVLIAAIPTGLMLSKRENPSVTTTSTGEQDDLSGGIIGGIGDDAPEAPRKLTSDEIMQLETIHSGGSEDREVFESLDEELQYIRDLGALISFASVKVTDIQYYLVWYNDDDEIYPHMNGYAICTLQIESIVSSENANGFSVGDQLYMRNYITVYPTDNQEMFDVVAPQYSKRTGIPLENLNSLDDIESGTYELVPIAGKKYRKYVSNNILPLNAGEKYTLAILGESSTGFDGRETFGYKYACPIEANSLTDVIQRYHLSFDLDQRVFTEELHQRILTEGRGE